MFSNIVKKDRLREVQLDVLKELRETLALSFGPLGSNTTICVPGRENQYSKDGHTILRNIKFNGIIEKAIVDDLISITEYIVKTVGDGTTSAIELAAYLFEVLSVLEKDSKIPPYTLIQKINTVIKELQEEINNNVKEFTSQTAYDIAMISSNGNTKIADDIYAIYERFGKDVFIDVGVSNTTENLIKIYDGMTLEAGYSDTAYINNTKKACSTLHKPKVYQFADPIDTNEQMNFLAYIIQQNIMAPYTKEGQDAGLQPVPTVIMAPRISRDMGAFIGGIVEFMYSVKDDAMKPPLLIVTNISNADQFEDISRMCGCKPIRKYINFEQQNNDIEAGLAPTLDTILNFCGTADIVESDLAKTKFINPLLMFEEDMQTHSNTFNRLVEFLESELAKAYEENQDANFTGNLKRRLNSLKANMVEILIGGVSASDRDSLRDLVEDTVLNCRSAARLGYGYAANFEGLRAAYMLQNKSELHKVMFTAYKNLVLSLYGPVYQEQITDKFIEELITTGCPINIRTLQYDDRVVSSIATDVTILEALGRILTVMVTSNQFITPSPLENSYMHSK